MIGVEQLGETTETRLSERGRRMGKSGKGWDWDGKERQGRGQRVGIMMMMVMMMMKMKDDGDEDSGNDKAVVGSAEINRIGSDAYNK